MCDTGLHNNIQLNKENNSKGWIKYGISLVVENKQQKEDLLDYNQAAIYHLLFNSC